MNNNFLDIHIGDNVIAFDEYSHDYVEHILRIDSIENDEAYVTNTNPNGVVFYGTDLEKEEWEDDYITFVHEGNFVGIVKEENKTGNNVCPNCGCDPTKEPYAMEATHCPRCGGIFRMSIQRMKTLYDNMLNHISELVSGSDLVDTLHAIGFTIEEIIAEGFEIEEDE